MKPCLTILTPLYNRSEFIERLYYCLCAQSRKDFQWLIIDDGSTDRCDDKINEYLEYSEFPIDYVYKENGGKHTALNYSHPYIKADWVLILDSDDMLTGDAVESAASYIEKYGETADIGVISFQRGHSISDPLVKYEDKVVVSDHIEYRINKNRPGDSCEVVRADVLREFAFPVYVGERFMNESHLWIGSADKYKTVYVPKVIYICEYIEEGLTRSGRYMWRTCPMGGMHSQIVGLNKRCSFIYRAKRAILLHYYGRLLNMKVKDICRDSGYPAFVRLFTIPGYFLYRIWEKKYNKDNK
ncbi:MAG: glycosyltransferase family 2 protein [Clostridia bacterium]|nr:glycosyltransferase family 2 protein [Clostridia bacterium]